MAASSKKSQKKSTTGMPDLLSSKSLDKSKYSTPAGSRTAAPGATPPGEKSNSVFSKRRFSVNKDEDVKSRDHADKSWSSNMARWFRNRAFSVDSDRARDTMHTTRPRGSLVRMKPVDCDDLEGQDSPEQGSETRSELGMDDCRTYNRWRFDTDSRDVGLVQPNEGVGNETRFDSVDHFRRTKKGRSSIERTASAPVGNHCGISLTGPRHGSSLAFDISPTADIPERLAVMSSNINRLLDEKKRMVDEIVTSHKRPSAHRRDDVVILENQPDGGNNIESPLGLLGQSSDDVVESEDCDTALDIVADCINHSDQLVRVINDRLMPGNISTDVDSGQGRTDFLVAISPAEVLQVVDPLRLKLLHLMEIIDKKIEINPDCLKFIRNETGDRQLFYQEDPPIPVPQQHDFDNNNN